MARRLMISVAAACGPYARHVRGKRLIHTLLASLCLSLLSLVTGAHGEGFDRQVLAEMNLARTDPAAYADFLRDLRHRFQGKRYLPPGTHTFVQTEEGMLAVDEAIAFLSRQPPLPRLAWSEGLATAAAELAREQGKTGTTGHNGPKSGSMRERIERHGEWWGAIAENICYGPSDARLLVMEFIINDGVPTRGHRKNIFHGDSRTAGVSCGPHPRYGKMCVIDFADRFKEKGVRTFKTAQEG